MGSIELTGAQSGWPCGFLHASAVRLSGSVSTTVASTIVSMTP
jgi:hypothetical protein